MIGMNLAGAFAEQLSVPERCLVPIPATLADRGAALLLPQREMNPQKLAAMSPDERSAKIAAWTEDARKHWSVDNGELVNEGFNSTADRGRTAGRARAGLPVRRAAQLQRPAGAHGPVRPARPVRHGLRRLHDPQHGRHGDQVLVHQAAVTN